MPKKIVRPKTIDERRSAVGKLQRQLLILEARIEQTFAQILPGPVDESWHFSFELINLDTETFYTVAHDLVKVIALLLEKPEKTRFEKESAYRAVCRIRNELIRHAYDATPIGNAYCGFGIGEPSGPVLKCGSGADPNDGFLDEGLFRNRDALYAVCKEYGYPMPRLTNVELTCLLNTLTAFRANMP